MYYYDYYDLGDGEIVIEIYDDKHNLMHKENIISDWEGGEKEIIETISLISTDKNWLPLKSLAASQLGRIGGRIGGKSKSDKKKKSSAINGKLGGRPKGGKKITGDNQTRQTK